ncbi:MAG: DNA replication and repair protein RecF [Candidatus Saccharimonas sp.]
MRVQSLRVQHFRIHDDRELLFSEGVTVILGGNGTGKTSLIEALHVMLRGTSFRGSDDSMKNADSAWYRIDCAIDNEYALRYVKYQGEYKEFVVEDKKSRRLSLKHKHPVVLFEPDVLRMLTSSPARRREYLDSLITQVDETYAKVLRRYDRALRQRNNLLKQQASDDQLFAWNVTLSEYGAYIVMARQKAITRIAETINQTYQSIAQKDDEIHLEYSFSATEQLQQKLLYELERTIDRDRMLGATTTGPHRHDLIVYFNGSLITDVASRGEVRTVVLALKFIEVSLIESVLDKQPIILLDDVFGELDETRQKELIHSFRDYQIIITATSIPKTKLSASIIRL